MQTFVPLPDLPTSAAVLDDRRLGKQRVETLQILRALHLEDYGWANHPAVTMWRGHTPALVAYGLAIVDEWLRRGYGDTTRPQIAEFVHPDGPPAAADLPGLLPPWWGDDRVHRSHRSALLRKDPDHYRDAFGPEPDDLPYVWPDPPAPPPAPRPWSAWVVRGRVAAAGVSIDVEPGDLPWVPLDARTGRIRKRDRQVARLVEELAPGDLVTVPLDDRFRVGRVTGGYRRSAGRHRRPVAWITELRRRDLRFPAALQDPQTVFALRGEPLLDDLRSTG
ncbi:MAG: MSMEG_6728 family protein [Actinobacteria bacterium]|nr:MSMEG_6728 family protein [Actinomycetota bacterium]